MFGRDEWGGVLPAGNGAVRPTARVNLAGKEYYGQR